MPEKILLAGCGDLGSRVAARLAATHTDLGALVGLRRHPVEPAAAPAPMTWLAADVTRPDTLANLPRGITRVVYALTPGGRNEAAYRAVFIDGLHNLCRALDVSALRRFVFVSSSAVYGEHDGAWTDEDSGTEPLSYNGRVLLEAERWLAGQDFSSASLRLAGIYGPGRMQLVERIREGRAVAPRQPRHWSNRVHVEDAANAIAHVLFLPSVRDTYVVSDDVPLPLDELYSALAGMLRAPAVGEGPAPAGVGSKRLSNARLKSGGFVFGWPDAREGYRDLLARHG